MYTSIHKEEGVSPAIAVILMVALTVVLVGIFCVVGLNLAGGDETQAKQVFVTAEAQYDKDAPLLVTIHGGPELAEMCGMRVEIYSGDTQVSGNTTRTSFNVGDRVPISFSENFDAGMYELNIIGIFAGGKEVVLYMGPMELYGGNGGTGGSGKTLVQNSTLAAEFFNYTHFLYDLKSTLTNYYNMDTSHELPFEEYECRVIKIELMDTSMNPGPNVNQIKIIPDNQGHTENIWLATGPDSYTSTFEQAESKTYNVENGQTYYFKFLVKKGDPCDQDLKFTVQYLDSGSSIVEALITGLEFEGGIKKYPIETYDTGKTDGSGYIYDP